MRPASLIALVLLSACGRSSLSPPAEAGVATDHAQSTELEVGAAWVGDAAADQPGVEIETTSRCSYHAADAYVVRCGGDFRLLSVMVDGRDDCPRYFVLERTGRTYAVLDDLLSDNGCDTLCRWESGTWVVRDCGGSTTYVTSYHDLFRRCEPIAIWYSYTTDTFYEDREEATATLPSCQDE